MPPTTPADRIEDASALERECQTTPLPFAHGLQFVRRLAMTQLSIYVAANTGAVTARRSDLWRLYDSLWALHIMDWRDHENFNHPLIIAVTAITLISVIAGIVLIPYRIRFRKLRPRVGESRS